MHATSQPANRLLRLLNDLYCGHIMPLTATLLARDRSGAYRYLPRSVETFHAAEDLATLAGQCGFRDVRVTALDMGICSCVVGRV